MKKLIVSLLIGLAMVAFTGCTKNSDADAAAKCSASGKCSGDNAKEAIPKCGQSGKYGK